MCDGSSRSSVLIATWFSGHLDCKRAANVGSSDALNALLYCLSLQPV